MASMYQISIKEWREKSAKTLRENKQAYNALKDKTTIYAREIKALQDLHRKVDEIYKSAPSNIQLNTSNKGKVSD